MFISEDRKPLVDCVQFFQKSFDNVDNLEALSNNSRLYRVNDKIKEKGILCRSEGDCFVIMTVGCTLLHILYSYLSNKYLDIIFLSIILYISLKLYFNTTVIIYCVGIMHYK